MNMKPECFVCLYQQSLRVVKAAECGEKQAIETLKDAAALISDLDPDQTPPEAAALLYPRLSKLLQNDDPYKKLKKSSVHSARKLIQHAREKITDSANPLDAALRAAVAGNVIDFATEKSFDLDEEFDTIFSASFATDEKEDLISRLHTGKKVVIIGDNVGEHLFDALLIETLSSKLPHLEISYFTRGVKIINDIVAEDAVSAGAGKYAEIVDSGVDTPGFLYSRASDEARRHYDQADLILAKGMGNFECLESERDPRLYFLFKVKCSVVAGHIGKNTGDLICMRSGS